MKLSFILFPIFIAVLSHFLPEQKQKNEPDYVAYHLLANEGVLAFLEARYADAISHFEAASVHAPFFYDDSRNDYYTVGACYAKLEKAEKAHTYLKEALITGYDFKKLEKDTLLTDFRTTKFWNKLVANQATYKQTFFNSLDTVLRKKILEMSELNVRYRYDKTGAFRQLMREADEANLEDLKKILKDGNIPLYKQVGTSDIIHIMKHMPRELREPYVESLREEIVKGNLAPMTYAMFVDNYHYHSGIDTTVYGVGTSRNHETGLFEFAYKIEDFPNIAAARKSIGLYSVEQQQRFLDLTMNKK